jgi:hypothetical protein
MFSVGESEIELEVNVRLLDKEEEKSPLHCSSGMRNRAGIGRLWTFGGCETACRWLQRVCCYRQGDKVTGVSDV